MLGALCTHIVTTIDVLKRQNMEDINRKDQPSHFTNAKLYLSIGMTIGVMVLLILIFKS